MSLMNFPRVETEKQSPASRRIKSMYSKSSSQQLLLYYWLSD
jgi:hypothetical protein